MQGTVRSPFLLAAALLVVALVHLRLLRPHILNWGATASEVSRRMPGDDVLPDAGLQTTRCISVDASPQHIWPWLVQMGPRPRAGAYTYDWIERLLGIDIENKDRILGEFQHLEVGEAIGMNSRGQGLVVRAVEDQRHLVLQWIPALSTWAFALYPEGEKLTRLVSRNRLRGSGPFFWLGMVGFMEPASLVMEREMLRGIRRRAEALAANLL